MKNRYLILYISSFLIVSCSNQYNNQGDLTSADAILNHLKKKNQNLDRDDICIDKISGFSEFFIVGYFAHDLGCSSPDYYFEGNEVTLEKNTIKEILMNGNFEENNLAAVEAYHKNVINHYEYSLTTAPDEFDESKHTFSAPNTIENSDMIVSQIWIQERGGMLPEVSFHLSTLKVDLDGVLIDHQTSNHFTVQYN